MARRWLQFPRSCGEKQRGSLDEQSLALEIDERPIDLWLFFAVLVLVVIGTLEVFASSAAQALDKYGNPTFLFRRHLAYVVLGFAAMWFAAFRDYRWLRRRTYGLLLLSLALLASVLFVGVEINGARRWFRVGPLTFQPVEIAKLALISYLAYSLGKKADKVKTFTIGFVPHLLVCAIMMVLLLRQPDLGSAIVLGATTMALLFVAGTKISYISLAVLAAAPAAYYMVVGTPWRLQRFLAYLNPEAYANGAAYQLVQSQIAIGSGGLTGLGLGQGRQALGYMPEGHSDFILAGIGEELGFFGLCLIFACFAVLVCRGIRAARDSRDVFGAYLAFGITIALGIQALFNCSVVLGVIPNKGITLPLVSYGGSSLVLSMYLVGLLLSVGRRPRRRPAKRAGSATIVIGAKRKAQRAVVSCG